MKILITGGAGFIGTALAKSFDSKNVILVDLPGKFKKHHAHYEKHECDITDFDSVMNLPKADIVYHLAAQVGTHGSLSNLGYDLNQNVSGTLNVLEWAKKKQVQRFVFSSSMAVYGNRVLAKETDPTLPLSPYGISKLAAEYYVNYFKKTNPKSSYCIFRIYNCYGPGQETKKQTKGLASIFLEQARHKGDYLVTGTLDRTRDLIHIDDVISALSLPAEKDYFAGTFNLCTGVETSIKDLLLSIDQIASVDDFNVRSYKENILQDPLHATGNNDKLMSHGWIPRMTLEHGLKKCWEIINE